MSNFNENFDSESDSDLDSNYLELVMPLNKKINNLYSLSLNLFNELNNVKQELNGVKQEFNNLHYQSVEKIEYLKNLVEVEFVTSSNLRFKLDQAVKDFKHTEGQVDVTLDISNTLCEKHEAKVEKLKAKYEARIVKLESEMKAKYEARIVKLESEMKDKILSNLTI